MSMENLKKFMELVEVDEMVAKRLEEIGTQNKEGLIAYSKELDLEFSEKDLEEFKDTILNEKSELSEDQLNSISGGFLFRRRRRYQPPPPPPPPPTPPTVTPPAISVDLDNND